MMRCLSRHAWAIAAVLLSASLVAVPMGFGSAHAQQTQQAAVTDPASLPDQEIGRRFTVKPEDLPPPHTGPVVASRSLTVPYAGQTLRVPEGFTATPFATGLANPRRLLVLPNGDVIVAEQRAGYLTLLRDQDGDGKADWVERHAEGFKATLRSRLARPRCARGRPGRDLARAAPGGRLAPGPQRSSSAPPTCRRTSACRRRTWWARR